MKTEKNKLQNAAKNPWFIFLMCLFFGTYGVHRFFLGRWGSGIAMICLSIFGISTIWAIIDLILIALGKLSEKPPKIKDCYAVDGKKKIQGVVF